MKVVLVADHYDIQAPRLSGIGNYILRLANGLRKYSDIQLLTIRLRESSSKLGHVDYVFQASNYSPLSLMFRNLKLCMNPKFHQLLKSCDVMHVSAWGSSYTPLLLQSSLSDVKFVTTIHDIGNIVLSHLYKYGYMERMGLLISLKLLGKYADAVIAVSEATRET